MAKELSVEFNIVNTDLEKSVAASLKRMTGVKVVQHISVDAVRGAASVDIIILDDPPGQEDLFNRLRAVSDRAAGASIFVISANRDPQNIIDVMKAGASEYLVEPVAEQNLHNAVEDVRARLANAGKLAQGRLYSFISAKGGVGSTALSVNTAAAFAMSKKSAVALIDMSFQSGDASVLLDIVPQNTIYDICRNIDRLDVAFLRGVMCGHTTGLSFLAAPQNPEDCEDINSEHIASILNLSSKLYDQILLDCTSMHVNDISVEVFKRSDKVFVVTDMSVPSIRNTVRLCKLIRKFDISADKIEIIINRYIKGGALSLGEIEKSLEKPVYWLVPNDFSDIVSSINRGIPLIKLAPSAPFSRNISMLIQKIQNTLDDHDFRGVRGTFGKAL
jgi:pilus assembly protein CpaE